jgi:hypothetical protein
MIRPRSALIAAVLGGSLLASGAASTFAASAHAQNHRARAYGQVHLVPGGFILTLKHPRADGATTVTVQVPTNPAPKEIARKGTTVPLDEGDYALVVGTKSTTGLVASRVLYSDAPFKVHRSRAIGTVTAITLNGSTLTSITIQTKKGKSLDFEITAQTHYRVNKQLQSAAPTFAQGERVAIRFTIDKATKHRLALVISVRPTKAPSATTP